MPNGQSTSWATLSIRFSQSIRCAHGLGPAHGAGSTQSVPQTTCHGAGPSPQMIEKMTAKWLSLATTSILGQAPSDAAYR